MALLAHRYLGIVLGVLMLTWCLSGFVMMYVPYPALQQPLRLSALTAIDWGACCTFPGGEFAAVKAASFQLEMLGRDPVLRMTPEGRGKPVELIDLRDGREFVGVSLQQAQSTAAAFGQALGFAGTPIEQGSVAHDQWTVAGNFRKDGPLFRFTWPDPRRPMLYISSRTGTAVQLTTASQRFWNWMGAIPHWIYFTSLRERPELWTQVVVWSSALGAFLTLIGLYLGLLQYWRMRNRGRLSPYRGFLFLHHVPGLVFGMFTLTWVLSGLISMNPWGFLEEAIPNSERGLVRGEPMSAARFQDAIMNLKAAPSPFPVVSVKSAPLAGSPKLLLLGSQGQKSRVDEFAAPSPLTSQEVSFIASRLAGETAAPVPTLLTAGDTYYFSHHNHEVALPAYRLITNDAQHTRYYLDPVSGALMARFGVNARRYRWLHEGAHRGDFIQRRPLWDALMIVLLCGVTFVCGTGAYLGLRRLLPFHESGRTQ